jgi:nicotinate-nucleotide adenylyltransferase
MRRVGLFGGTFDPPHVGHLMIAECACEALGLEHLVFVPSGTPPHKRGRRVTPAASRVAMTRLATRGNPAFSVSTVEARRRGASYTVDTLRRLHAASPRTRFYLVIGEDSLKEFHTWREPEAILELATLAVAPRPGSTAARRHAQAAKGRDGRRAFRFGPRDLVWLDSPRLALSSSEVRARARAGRSIRYLVPDRVAAYVARHRLYRGR